MSYRCELRESIDDTDLTAWNAVRGDAADPFTDPRFVRAVEHGLPQAGKYRTAIVRGETPSALSVLGSGGLAFFYILLAGWFFTRIYRHAVRTGLIARYSAESLS